MSSGATVSSTLSNAASGAAAAASAGLKSLTNSMGITSASGSYSGGARRARNNRGRFLSKRKAVRVTLKKRAAKAVTVGTKAQVFHGTAKHTSGGLTRKDLMKTKKGRIVSKRKHAAGRVALRRLKAAGYSAKKGTFKLFRK
jgi:DVNP family